MSNNYKNNPDFRNAIRNQIVRGIDRASIALQSDLKQVLSTSPSPSAPGQPPGVDTGTLRRSVQVDRSQVDSELKARVGTNVEYARPLEYGTINMAARPWMRPTVTTFKDKLASYFVEAK